MLYPLLNQRKSSVCLKTQQGFKCIPRWLGEAYLWTWCNKNGFGHPKMCNFTKKKFLLCVRFLFFLWSKSCFYVPFESLYGLGDSNIRLYWHRSLYAWWKQLPKDYSHFKSSSETKSPSKVASTIIYDKLWKTIEYI